MRQTSAANSDGDVSPALTVPTRSPELCVTVIGSAASPSTVRLVVAWWVPTICAARAVGLQQHLVDGPGGHDRERR